MALVAASCSGDEQGVEVVDRLTADDGLKTSRAVLDSEADGVEPAREAELAAMLADVDLAIDRTVDLPGTEEVAFVVVADGPRAIDVWTELRTRVSLTGRYPVIVGGPRDFGGGVESDFEVTRQAWEFLDGEPSTVDDLAAADAVDLDAWTVARSEYLGVTPDDLAVDGSLAGGFEQATFLSTVDVLTGEPLDWVEIALLPTSRGWEAPVYLRWGGWNDVPPPHELTAILRHWSGRYGADVVAMTSDVVEFTVTAPPADDAEAVALAREHFLVAPDLVWQGTGDLDVLAAGLRDAPIWFFWWD